jgi:hypothetical protein
MDDRIAVDPGVDEDLEAAVEGSTFIFGSDGWESVDYVDPTAEWSLQSDGSFVSPDGTTRSWPIAGPEPG